MARVRLLLPVALASGIATLVGCSSKPEPEPEYLGTPFEVTSYSPDLREHHSSWGHTGRGGAALRKPSYQPVLASPDTLDTRYGKLHPELQYQPKPVTATVAVPPSLYAGTCKEPALPEEPVVAVMVPSQGSPEQGERITTLANSKGTVNEYIQVRNKLCRGAERLTYEEWEILVMGTPKDVPLGLKPSSLRIEK